MSKEDVKDSKMTVFLVIYVIKVSGLFLRTYKFLQFCKIQEEAITSSCLLLATPMITRGSATSQPTVLRIKVRTLTTCSGTMVPPRWCAPCSSRSISTAGSKVCWDLRLVVSKLGILSLFVVVSIPKFGVPALGNSVTAVIQQSTLPRSGVYWIGRAEQNGRTEQNIKIDG